MTSAVSRATLPGATVTIDGVTGPAVIGQTLFDCAEAMGVVVPTSCLKQGKCRECLVEIEAGALGLSAPAPQESHLGGRFRLACRTLIAEPGDVRAHTLKRGSLRIETETTGLEESLPRSRSRRDPRRPVRAPGRKASRRDRWPSARPRPRRRHHHRRPAALRPRVRTPPGHAVLREPPALRRLGHHGPHPLRRRPQGPAPAAHPARVSLAGDPGLARRSDHDLRARGGREPHHARPALRPRRAADRRPALSVHHRGRPQGRPRHHHQPLRQSEEPSPPRASRGSGLRPAPRGQPRRSRRRRLPPGDGHGRRRSALGPPRHRHEHRGLPGQPPEDARRLLPRRPRLRGRGGDLRHAGPRRRDRARARGRRRLPGHPRHRRRRPRGHLWIGPRGPALRAAAHRPHERAGPVRRRGRARGPERGPVRERGRRQRAGPGEGGQRGRPARARRLPTASPWTGSTASISPAASLVTSTWTRPAASASSPICPATRIVKVGNAALLGAAIALLSRHRRADLEAMVRRVEHVRLEAHPNFFEFFVEGCQFASFGSAA